MRWHWQNLNEDRRGHIKGSGFWHGRAWFNMTERLCINPEWYFRSRSCACEVSIGGEDVLSVHLAFPPISLFLTINYRPWWKVLPNESMCTGVRIFERAIWLQWWRESMGDWRNYGSYWRNAWHNRELVIHLDDLVLGRAQHACEILEIKQGIVSMPEGHYPVTVTFERRTWSRPRWFSHSVLGALIECQTPIPFPGKGENSWDCGEDAVYSLSCQATTMAEAIGEITKSVLRSRERHGGSTMWKPIGATK